jgi:Ser/Thr protein kinase RdoA (MazF antagonist)
MGLTGVVTKVVLQLIRVETSFVRVDTERATDLDDVMDRMTRTDERYRYSVAWIDLDDAAMAPRGLDIGNLLGHLVRDRITGARSVRSAVEASEAFIDGYGPCAELDEGVLTGWTVLAVARLAGLAQSRHGDATQRDALLAYCLADLDRVAGASCPTVR